MQSLMAHYVFLYGFGQETFSLVYQPTDYEKVVPSTVSPWNKMQLFIFHGYPP